MTVELRIPEHPKLLQFETNTRCNGGCTFCAYSSMPKRPEMPMHRIVDLTYHLAYRVNEVFPFYMQEPLLEPRLLSILSNVKLYSPRGEQTLYTNMSRYPEATLTKIIKWGLVDRVVISFYGGDKQLHEQIQPGTPYAQTKRYIKQFVKLRDKLRWARPKIILAYLITTETNPDLPLVLCRWGSWGS